MRKRILFLFGSLLLFTVGKAQLENNKPSSAIPMAHVPGTACHNCVTNPGNQKNATPPSVQNGNASVAITYSNTACGLNYVTGSVVIEQRSNSAGISTPPVGPAQPAPIVISGVPAGATVLKAFLYADASGNGVAVNATLTNPGGSSTAYPMSIIGTDIDKCWSGLGYAATYSYRADVTSIVTGNGTYHVSGMPVYPSAAGPNDVDGATLVVIYSDPSVGYTGTLLIADGAQVSTGASISGNITGINVPATPTSGNNFVIIADLQQLQITDITVNGTTNNFPVASDLWWNTIQTPTSFTSGQTSCPYSISNSGDCYNLVAVGLYYQTNLANNLPTSDIAECNSFTTDTIKAGLGFSSYLWSTGATTSSITINSPGTYWVQATNALGCTVIDTINAYVINPNNVHVLKDTIVCSALGAYTANATYNGAQSYQWFDGSTNPIKNFTTSGTYSVNIHFLNGCVVTDSFHLTLNTKPTVNLGNDTIICGNISTPIILNAGSGPYTYSWSTGATTQTISVTTGGTYSVNVVSASGCGQTDNVNILVVGANATNTFDTSVCSAASFPMLLHVNALPGNNNYYYWSNGGYDTTDYIYNAGVYYLYIYVNGGTCVITDTFNIGIDTVHINDIVQCTSFTPTTASAGTGFASYLWSTGATTYTTAINSTGTYWIKVTSGGGCTSTDTFKVSVIQPNSIHVLKDTTFCSSNYYYYYYANAYVSGAQSYTWSTGSIGSAQYLYGTGTYWVDIGFSGGCVVRDSMNLTINQAPYVYLGYDMTFCTGMTSPVILDAGYGIGYTYQWSTSANTETISVNSAGTYSVDVTSTNGCSTIDSINITVLNIPTYPTFDTSVCNANAFPVTLNGPVVPGNNNYYYWSNTGYSSNVTSVYYPGNYYLYIYVNGGQCTITDTFNVILDTVRPHISDIVQCSSFTPTTVSAGSGYAHYIWSTGATTYSATINSVGSYSVQVTSLGGCLLTDTFSVKSLNLPVTPTKDTAICNLNNFPLTLHAPVIPGNNNYYSWSNGYGGPTDYVSFPGSYYVDIYVNGGTCVLRDSFNVSIDTARPHISDILYCNQIKHDTVNAGSGYTNYLWSSGITTNSLVINSTGTYWVKVVSNSGCVFRDTFLVSLNNINKPSIPNVSGCNPSSANVLNAGSGYTSYNWSTGSISQSITVNAAGNYWVTVTNTKGCSITDTVKVAYYTAPQINMLKDTSVCSQSDVIINATYPNTASYLWSDGFTSPVHALSTAGTYWVVYTLTTTCVASDTFRLDIKNVRNIDSLPNIVTPNNDGKNDFIDFGVFKFPNMQLAIYDRWGKKVLENTNPDFVWAPTCDDGTYFYVLAYTPACTSSDQKTTTIKGFITILR